MKISSLQNGRIKHLVKLGKRRIRDREGVMIIEGYRGIFKALENKFKINELYYCPECFLGENESELISRCQEQGALLFELTEPVFRKIAYRDRPEGLLALAPQFTTALDDIELGRETLLVVGEAIEKPGNLGTMLRSSDAAGADALVVCDACTDIFNPNVVCASVGTLFTVQIAEASSETFIEWALKNEFNIIATTPDCEINFTDIDMCGRTAIVMGTEQYGLTDLWLKHPDITKARINMYGQVDSLNVATAATLVLFEAVRQRQKAGILSK